jgi:hypothetical protein
MTTVLKDGKPNRTKCGGPRVHLFIGVTRV